MVRNKKKTKAKRVSTKYRIRTKLGAVISRVKCLGRQQRIVAINQRKRLRLMKESKEKERRWLEEDREWWKRFMAMTESNAKFQEDYEKDCQATMRMFQDSFQVKIKEFHRITDIILKRLTYNEIRKVGPRR